MREVIYSIDLAREENTFNSCMQNDDLKIILEVYNNRTACNLAGATARLNWVRPDGTPTKQEELTIENNIISFELNKNYTSIPGKAKFDVEITKDGTISTFPLEIFIVEKVLQSEKVSSAILELIKVIKIDDVVYELVNEINYSLKELQSKFENVVANVTNGNESTTNSEIVASRGGLTTLGERLDKIENGERILKSAIDFLHLNNSIKNIFDTRLPLEISKTEKGFLKSDGTVNKNESSTYTMKYYDVSTLDYVTIEGTALKGTSVYGLINSSEEIYEYKPFEVTEVAETTVDVRMAECIVVNSQSNMNMLVYKYETMNETKKEYEEKLMVLSNSIEEELNKIKEKIKDVCELVDIEKTEKGFLKSNGAISKNENSTYTMNYYNVENIDNINLKGNIIKSTAYGFVDSDENVLSYVGNTTEGNIEVDKIIEVPINAKYLITTIQSENSFEVNKYVTVSEGLNNIKNEILAIRSKMKTNYWNGKTICIFGTSVPRGDGAKNTYPYMLGEILNCTVINEAIGGSSVCCKKKSFTNWHNMPNDFSTAYRCFSNTLEEQEWVISQMAEGGLYEGNTMDADYIRNLSYEKKLVPYLDGTYPCPDLFILEFGPNDLRTTEDYDENAPYELTNYYGAMNFIIKTIFEYQPKARVMIMGHYENQSQERVILEGEDDYGARTIGARGIIPTKQQKVAEMWNIPIFKTWEYMGWSQMQIKTKGKWVNGYWQENYYDEAVEMTMLAYNLPDQSHPHSDKSGKANLKIAGSLAEFIENSIR